MDGIEEFPLDVSEFRCMTASQRGVVVVFEQTNRRYSYIWEDGELAIAAPEIQGACDPHPPEVVDCLARAVAYRAALSVRRCSVHARLPEQRTLSSHLRSFLARA